MRYYKIKNEDGGKIAEVEDQAMVDEFAPVGVSVGQHRKQTQETRFQIYNQLVGNIGSYSFLHLYCHIIFRLKVREPRKGLIAIR